WGGCSPRGVGMLAALAGRQPRPRPGDGGAAGMGAGAAASGARAREEVGRYGDVPGFRKLVSHAANPIGEPEDLVNEDDHGRLVLDLRINEETFHLAAALLDLYVFLVARRFFQSRFRFVLGRSRRSHERGH